MPQLRDPIEMDTGLCAMCLTNAVSDRDSSSLRWTLVCVRCVLLMLCPTETPRHVTESELLKEPAGVWNWLMLDCPITPMMTLTVRWLY